MIKYAYALFCFMLFCVSFGRRSSPRRHPTSQDAVLLAHRRRMPSARSSVISARHGRNTTLVPRLLQMETQGTAWWENCALGIPYHHVSPANGNMNGENEWTWWFRIGFRGTLFSGKFKYIYIYSGNLNFRCVIWVEIAVAQLLVSAGLPKSIQVSTAATALRLWCRRATVGDDQSRGDCRGVHPASPDAIHSEDVAGSAMAYEMASHALYCCVILKVLVVTAAKDVYHDYQD